MTSTPGQWTTEYQQQYSWKSPYPSHDPFLTGSSLNVTEGSQTSGDVSVSELKSTSSQYSPVKSEIGAQTKIERIQETSTQTTKRDIQPAAIPVHSVNTGIQTPIAMEHKKIKPTGVTPEILSYGGANISAGGGWADNNYMKTFNASVLESEQMPFIQERSTRTKSPEDYRAAILKKEAQALNSYRKAAQFLGSSNPAYQSEYQRQFQDWYAPLTRVSKLQQTADVIAAGSKEAAKKLLTGPPAHTLLPAGVLSKEDKFPTIKKPKVGAVSYLDAESTEKYPHSEIKLSAAIAAPAIKSKSASSTRPGILKSIHDQPAAGISHATEYKWREKRHFDVQLEGDVVALPLDHQPHTTHYFDTWNMAQQLLKRSKQRADSFSGDC